MKVTLFSGVEVSDAKLVMLGSREAGKSSIVNRLIRDTFSDNITATIGTAFFSKTLQVQNKNVKLQIWDTSGSERYRALTPMYFQNADAAIIVYDITSPQSFYEVESWVKTLKEHGPEKIVVGLAGNKIDLNATRAVDVSAGKSCAEKYGIPVFMETSAKTGENVLKIFTDIVNCLLNSDQPRNKPTNALISENQEKKSDCC